jgi:type II secretory pathway pseudopilin PulG
LIELTVVILVLLALITVLFIGARAWKRGSDRAACVINIRNAQQAVRSFQNLRGRNDGSPINFNSDLVGIGNFIETFPVCPAGGTYTPATAIPTLGTLVLPCSLATSQQHEPDNSTGW